MFDAMWWRIKAFARAEELSLSVFAILIGTVTGVGVALAHSAAQWLHEELFGLERGAYLSASLSLDPVRVFTSLIVGGLVVGCYTWAVHRLRRRDAVDPIEANALYGGRVSLTDSVLLTGGTVLSSGCGAAVGMEAGYTQFGAGMGSWLGRKFNLRRADLRTLVACGAAAGIAAAFDAPMAGAFYAFELVLGAYAVVTLAPVMLSALTAPAVAGLLTQELTSPLLNIDLYFSRYDIIVFVGIGVVAGVIGIWIMKMATAGDFVLRRFKVPALLRPALGGLGVAVLALYSPAVLGAGHGAMQYYLVHAHGFTVLLGLLAAKVLAAALSVGTGFRGGLFHTSLFVGILLGDVIGFGITSLFPALPVDRIVYALVGMASMAAAIIGAPITMIFLVFEQTGNIAIASGVMIGAVIASLIVRRLFGYSFATWRFHVRGESIRSAFDISFVKDLTVVKLMRREARTAGEHMTVAAFRKRFPIGSTERVFLVDEGGGYVGFVLAAEVHANGQDTDAETVPVRNLRHAPDVFLLPRQNINMILEAFDRAETETLAVVDDPQCRSVLGYVTEAHALRRYAQELDRRRRELSGER
ncbi:CIC family chloride channel protein [Pseudochelatococcus lubricantis]|uniref:CIC family chloride channel protein n=1 Tax=Pseudochelatococcus lubricantis TaxID=1538102 RepID=A0ABX0UTM0_9HYPH|nr:chloride channel protein [Pseudochelatococcus lubricantis]NIJ56303.1 CIC family chloride channel protein [Pseudochelatococcus lubricantis]